MATWHVQIRGERFWREGHECNFELSGVVYAANPNEAFSRAVTLAQVVHPELAQVSTPRSGPVINADEISEASGEERTVTEEIELVWLCSPTA